MRLRSDTSRSEDGVHRLEQIARECKDASQHLEVPRTIVLLGQRQSLVSVSLTYSNHHSDHCPFG